jgi:hypothetical protein
MVSPNIKISDLVIKQIDRKKFDCKFILLEKSSKPSHARDYHAIYQASHRLKSIETD